MPAQTPIPALPASHPDPFGYRRRRSRVVHVGRVAVGGDNPIRIQSMVVADTLDTEAVVRETLALAQAGCEIVRITAPTVEAARNLGRIRSELVRRGVAAPLVADIHFSPAAALEAAEHVEKVRINPGNFADSKRFAVREYSDAEYAAELERLAQRFLPLVEKLKVLHRALRIGVNHGSLSDRIMNRYGDTPLGMVECALEYVRLCESAGYRDVILSMKSSNPRVMVQAYRLLAARMDAEGMDYPLHLGVTEAGDGADGRIKSAVGIGSLLEDGLGDTVRVSLTEDSVREIPVARELARPFHARPPAPARGRAPVRPHADPYSYTRRSSRTVRIGPISVGGGTPVRVGSVYDGEPGGLLATLEQRLRSGGREPEFVAWAVGDGGDLMRFSSAREELDRETTRLALLGAFRGGLALALEGLAHVHAASWEPAGRDETPFTAAAAEIGIPILIEDQDPERLALRSAAARKAGAQALLTLAGPDPSLLLKEYRRLAALLAEAGDDSPLLLRAPAFNDGERTLLAASVLIGGLLIDGIGDAVEIRGAGEPGSFAGRLDLAYDVLQGAGARVSKAEFVSCPSCGRTLFDLQETTERIKARTAHLLGVRIAIMGCIVNGPGEMADADFGYVGAAPGRINLYVGRECVRKGVPAEAADAALIDLIKAHGRWVDPPNN